ncbi:MAG: RNase adapter RapZ [Alphaproteobacteria bacterium]
MTAKPSPSGPVAIQRPSASAAAARRNRLVVVTGMSGAGRTTALKALEDIGYEAVDNLPLSLMASLLHPAAKQSEALAIDIDIRTRDFTVDAFEAEIAPLLARDDLDVRLLFVDCDDEALRRRYTETRRRHPLADDRPLIDGIRHERALIERLRERADIVLDTSELAIGELRQLVAGNFALADRPALSIFVTSFSYRLGLPREADLVFDVRFLANPHYEERLRPLTGLDPAVGEHITDDPGFAPFFDSLAAMLLPLLPHFEREGKSYLTVAIGCTGGRHRSVFVAERLAAILGERGRRVHVRHRDINRSPV